MRFVVLFGGVFIPPWLMLIRYQAIAHQKYRRLWWYGGLLLTNVLFAAGYVSQRHRGEGAALIWNCAAGAALLSSMVIWLITPAGEVARSAAQHALQPTPALVHRSVCRR